MPSSPRPARLSLTNLSRVPIGARPQIEPSELDIGVVHFGPGSFHRAHQAPFIEAALAAEWGAWGISAVAQRSRRAVRELRPQDGLFALTVRHGADSEVRVIATEREVLDANAEWPLVRARIACPATHLITLTVTEKGYTHDPASGRLRVDHPAVRHDLRGGGGEPESVVGRLADCLDARRAQDGGALTIISCDNIASNGALLAGLLGEFCALLPTRRGRELLAWMQEHASFPCSVVDRFVPATSVADRREAAVRLGLRDAGTVVSEPWSQWVLEDSFAGPRPAWERAGVRVVADHRPWERAKLRLVNAGHSALAYLGLLAGYRSVAEAMADERLARYVRDLLERDCVPTLRAADGLEPSDYASSVLQRLCTTTLRHRLEQIAADGSQKLGVRLLAVVRDRLAEGATPRNAALAVAAWIRYLSRRRSDEGRRRLAVQDPLEPQLAELLGRAADPRELTARALAFAPVFGAELRESAALRELLEEQLAVLAAAGALGAVDAIA